MRFAFNLWVLLAAGVCGGQEIELPASSTEIPTIQLAAFDGCDSDEIELSRFKKQALQSIAVSAGYMADADGNGFNGSYLDASIGSGIPLGSFDNIVGVRPRFRVDWFDAAPTIDIPSELYQFELQFFYRRPISERLSAMAIVSPSIRSDLTTSDNAFRVFALALLNWQCIPDRLT
ncbi:MAG: hypothetical protein WBD31_17515, partial [Rubripirellula sp.]